ncbi:MAG: phosphoenolpyruvate synthase [Deltaproteobacteria bacterium]|nr:phosphoenolpyruvate synthase [Deltaproteobacteria bacterium]
MKAIITYQERSDEAAVGGKFARQAVMAKQGLNVPPFFCLTAAFFRKVYAPLSDRVRARLASVDFTDSRSVQAAASEIQGWLANLPVPPSLEAQVNRHFDRLFKPGDLVAVRASAVGNSAEESEDSAENPFAGMSESFLYVRRDQLLDRIRGAWASGFSAKFLAYRHALGLDLVGFAVAVGVQKMIFGERSFVLFTCEPKTAARDAVLACGHGIGEGVVQEKVAVDHFFVSFQTGAIKREIAHKAEHLTFDAKAGSGLTPKPVPEELRDRSCLTDDEIRAIVALGRKVEKIFGGPQDIEGTLTADGSVHLLQSRPVSLDYRRQRVWTNANVTESFPGVTTALTFSFSRFFYREIFADCYRRLGISEPTLRQNFPSLDKMIGFLGGRVYYCLTSFYHLHSQSPLFPLFRGHWERMMGFGSSYQATAPTMLGRLRERAVKGAATAAATANFCANFATHERQVHAFHSWWEALASQFRGKSFEGEDPIVLIGEFHRVWGEVGSHWGVTLLNDTYLPLLYGAVEHLFSRWGLSQDESLLSDLLCGDESLLSTEIVLSAVDLAEKARHDPSLMLALGKRRPEDLWDELANASAESSFARALKDHLHRFGDRGLQELKMEQPNLRHTPWRLLEMVAAYARSDATVASLRAKEAAIRAAAEERLTRALRSYPARRAFLRALLATLRRLIRNRENSRYCRSELFGFSKNVFRALGAKLAAASVLRQADDVYHLTMEEIFGYFDGTGVTENLQVLADTRRREFDENLQRETATLITTLGPVRSNPLFESASEGMDGQLRGLGSSAGRVRGTARVVLDPNKPLEVGKDMILVARETDPGWLFLMLCARGLVVERGSMLSHTAITGRKFGIPTVVGVADATRRIPDGAPIEIDGATGLVTLLTDGDQPPMATPGAC